LTSFAFALLADGRFPAGGHAHSAGVEAAVAEGRVVDEVDLEAYARGRLHTAGRTEAALAAAALLRLDDLAAVDAEAEARITPAPLRAASRRLGRQLVRAASGCWPSAVLAEVTGAFPDGAHQPVALGAVGASAGLDHLDVARLALHHAVTTALQAGVRLLGLDPFVVATLTARLGEEAEPVAVEAAALAAGPLRDLPSAIGPIVDIAAVAHAGRDGTLFAT
jgi:urease accessory protein